MIISLHLLYFIPYPTGSIAPIPITPSLAGTIRRSGRSKLRVPYSVSIISTCEWNAHLSTHNSNSMAEPQIFIGEKPYRSSTYPIGSPSDEMDIVDDSDDTPLEQLLRRHKIENAHDSKQYFWSLQRLRCILSRSRILSQLRKYSNLENAEAYIDHIRPEDDWLAGAGSQTYLKIFALLVSVGQGGDIGNFINEQVSDQSLPVCLHPDRTDEVILCRKDMPTQPLKCFEKWQSWLRELFETKQWQVLIPYFDLDTGKRAQLYSLDDKTILPWCPRDEGSLSSSQPSRNEGGYASVSCIKIHPSCHGFSEVLEAVSRSL